MSEDKHSAVISSTNTRRSGLFYGYIIVLCSFLLLLIIFGTNYSFGIFFNRLLSDLGWSRAVTSVGYSLAQMISGIAGLIAGRLCDKFGPRVIVLACGVSLALGCLLMPQVKQPWQLYIFYGFFVGIGFGGASVPITSTVSRWFTRTRGLMTGIVMAGIGAGTIVIPFLANFLLWRFDWRNSFLLIGFLVLAVVIPSALFLKRDPAKISDQTNGQDDNESEKKLIPESGLSFREAAHTGTFWVICLIFVCFSFYAQATMVHIVPHARSLGVGDSSAAVILPLIGAGTIIGLIAMGSLSDRIGVKYTLAIAVTLMLLVFVWLRVANNLWMLYLFALIFGFSFGALSSLQSLTMAKMFGLVSLGTLVGVLTCIHSIGGTIGPIITGYIFDINGNYYLAFIFFIILAIVQLALVLSLRPPRKVTF